MTGAASATLPGAWAVAELNGVAVEAADPPTLELLDGGRLTGYAGVNRLAGDWSLAGETLTVGPLAMTRMAGPPERMALERALVALLAVPLAVTGDGGDLVLRAEAGSLRLRPALSPRPPPAGRP